MSGITTTVVPTTVTTVSDTRESDLVVVAPLIVTDTSQSEIVTTVSAAETQTTVAGTYASLVVVGSEIITTVTAEQGPRGTDASSVASTFDATNKQGSSINPGLVVATHSSGTGVYLANATNDTKPAVGLNTATAASLATATIQTAGPFELVDWTAVTGTTLLTGGSKYYLSTSNGLLTTTSPTTSPNVSHLVGRAVSATVLVIGINQFLKL